mgnify:CR=1 FL=1
MDAKFHGLYSELRNTKKELIGRLSEKELSAAIESIIIEEIKDIESAIQKMNTGIYGKCEISGELIPLEVLHVMPTIKTMDDIEDLGPYFRKPFYS